MKMREELSESERIQRLTERAMVGFYEGLAEQLCLRLGAQTNRPRGDVMKTREELEKEIADLKDRLIDARWDRDDAETSYETAQQWVEELEDKLRELGNELTDLKETS